MRRNRVSWRSGELKPGTSEAEHRIENSMNSGSQRRPRHQRGYILLTLMLFVALLTIGMLAMVENIESQIKRDREEELIHRGVQYSRAVQHYFKKFSRYPNRIEDLENTNNIRFLRKRYKDPITGKDFKLLHMTDVQMSLVGGVPGAGLPSGGLNASTAGGLNGAASGPGGLGPQAIATQNSPATDQSGTGDTADQSTTPGVAPGQPSAQPQSVRPGQAQSIESGPGSGQVFGGGAIVGVASTSKNKTIREFNQKNHYNQWQFIYDPTSDRGGLLMTPNQPPLKGAVSLTPASGTQGTPGQNPGLGMNPQGPGASPPPQQPTPQPPDQ
jgi:type II secretory pathway pseudopilin PulG